MVGRDQGIVFIKGHDHHAIVFSAIDNEGFKVFGYPVEVLFYVLPEIRNCGCKHIFVHNVVLNYVQKQGIPKFFRLP